ncbi:hypothetical protein ANCCAN_02862 [Ancylostoma caninum]|uniref:Uncharacterized protein n=1 Tax=Ancylostoma caninum TaxID=29170 RepID=A0A368H732_ANCCA|nr:hypothetical protein ANCCAN_02862 [Ancylostoma caninum]
MKHGPLQEVHPNSLPVTRSALSNYPRKPLPVLMEHASAAVIPWIDNTVNRFSLLFIDENNNAAASTTGDTDRLYASTGNGSSGVCVSQSPKLTEDTVAKKNPVKKVVGLLKTICTTHFP